MEVVETDSREEAFYSLSETARLLGVSERTMTRWIQAGKLPAYRPGREYRIRYSDIEAFLEERREVPLAEREPHLFNGGSEERSRFIERCRHYVAARVAHYENRLAEAANFTGAKTLQDDAFEEFSRFLDLTNGEAIARWLEDPAISEATKEELGFDLVGAQRPFMQVVGRIGDRVNELAETPAEKDEAERSVVNLEEYFRSHRAS